MDLTALETEAKQHLENVTHEWNAFCQVVERIKDSGLWREKAHTWGAYCKQVFGVTDSRIRQHLNAHELSQRMETITGIPLTSERQARYVREFADTPDKQAQIHVLATNVANELGEPIAQRHYKSVDKVLNEIAVTTGNATVQGEQISIHAAPDVVTLAILDEAREAGKRLKEYKTQGLQDVPVTVLAIDGRAYAVLVLPNDYPVGLLKNYMAKVPKHTPAIVSTPQASPMAVAS